MLNEAVFSTFPDDAFWSQEWFKYQCGHGGTEQTGLCRLNGAGNDVDLLPKYAEVPAP